MRFEKGERGREICGEGNSGQRCQAFGGDGDGEREEGGIRSEVGEGFVEVCGGWEEVLARSVLRSADV